MTRTVKELMNRQVFSCRAEEDAQDALEYLLTLGVHAAPVLDDGRCVGVVSVSNLVGDLAGSKVRDRMSGPAACIGINATLHEAAGRMADTEFHHLVVLDTDGRVAGFVSALDVLRAVTGRGGRHPTGTANYDPESALEWSRDAWLDREHASRALDGPGVLVLIAGEPGAASATIAWAEAAENVRTRLLSILEHPPARVTWHLRGGPLSFRCAPVVGPARRRQAFGAILARLSE